MMGITGFSKVKVALGLVVGISCILVFSVQGVQYNPGCKERGSAQARFLWVTQETPGSSVTLTSGPCGVGGDSATGYIFMFSNAHPAICKGSTPCSGYDWGCCENSNDSKTVAVIKVSGNQKAFQDIFPAGISFSGDYCREIENVCYCSSVNVTETGKEYVLRVAGGEKTAIIVDASILKCDLKYSNTHFGISVTFYEGRGSSQPGSSDCMSQMASTNGSIKVAINQRTGTTSQNFVPDPRSGSNIASIKTVTHEYDRGQFSATIRRQNQTTCSPVTVALGAYQPVDCSFSIPQSETYYLVKVPGWEKAVVINQGLPSYMAQEGWEVDTSNNRVIQNRGTLGSTVYHLGHQVSQGQSLSKVENVPGNNQDPWYVTYSGDRIVSIHKGGDPNDPDTFSKKYEYGWGTALNGNQTLSVDFVHDETTSDERSWHVEFDHENRAVQYTSGCQTGCSGGNGEYQNIEYYDPEYFGIDPNHPDYSSFQDLIKARYIPYNNQDVSMEEFTYQAVSVGEYVPGYSVWIDNPSFAFPNVPESTCQQPQSGNIGWDVDTLQNIQICNDPNNSMDSTDHQYLKINSEATLTQNLEWISEKTRYTLKARFRSVVGQTGTATIWLLSTNQSLQNPMLLELGSGDADIDGWMEGSWESMNYRGDFYNWETDRLSIQINGTNAEIDCIQLTTEAYIEHKIPQLAEHKIRLSPSGNPKMVLKRDFDTDNKIITEHRQAENDTFRVTKYEFEDSSFKTWIKKTDYSEKVPTEYALPSGNSFTTTNDPNHITGYVITYPKVNTQDVHTRKDIELHSPYQAGSTKYLQKDFYTFDIPNQRSYSHTYTLEELLDDGSYNQWAVIEQSNGYGAKTQYEYETVSGRYRLKRTVHPVTSSDILVTALTYDDAQRVIEEKYGKAVGVGIDPLRTRTYQYNAVTGFLDSTTDTHDGISATTRYLYNSFGQVIRQINPDDVATGKFYGEGGELLSEFVISSEDSDPNTIAVSGLWLISQTKYVYDDQGRIEEIHKAKDNVTFLYNQPDGWIKTKFVFDGQGRKIQQIEDYQNTNLTTYYQYNLQGELEQVTYPTGRWVKTYRNGRGLVEIEEVGYGQTEVYETQYSYDDNGNLYHQINPDGTELYYTYDNVDHLQKVARHTLSGPSTVKEYNSTGTVKRQYALDGSQQILTDSLSWYDTLGRVTMEIAQADPEQTNDPNFVDEMEDRVLLYGYDLAGNLYRTIQKGPGNTSLTAGETGDVILTHDYDGMGRRIETLNSEGILRRFQYTKSGQLWKTIDPVTSDPNLLFETENLYDSAGRLWKTINAEGDYTESEYNSLNQLIRQTVYDCDDTPEIPADDFKVRQIRYAYDNLGNQILKVVMRDPASTAEAQPWIDWITESVYDPNTNLLEHQIQYYGDEGTAVTSFFYDQIGRQIRVVDPEGNEEILYYDPDNGVQILTKEQIENCPDDPDSDYTITTRFTYDNFGRKETETLDRAQETDLVTTYSYTPLDQVETITSPSGVVTLYEYNAFGQRFRTTEDAGSNSFNMNRETESVYDRLGRQVEVVAYDPDETTPEVTLYQFDTANRLEKITYPDDKYIAYTYGWLDKIQNELRRDGTRIYYGYNRVGNLLWESDICLTDPNFIGIDPEYETGFEYDAAGQLTHCSKWDTNGLVAESTFLYNGFGLAESEETTYFDLDPITTEWAYDGSGNLTSQTHNSTTLTYTHDGLGRIQTIDQGELQIAEYAYVGRNTHTLSYPDADVIEQYSYDDLGRLDGIGSSITNDPLLNLVYTYDENSNRDSVKYEHLASPVWDIYSYDRLQRLSQAEYSSGTGLAMLEELSGDILFAASVGTSWISSDQTFLELAQTRLQSIRNQQKRIQTALAKSGLDRVIRKYNDGQMPVVTLVEFTEVEAEISEAKSTSTYEMVRDDNGKVIAIVVMDEAGRITLFTLYPDVGGTVIVRSSYDMGGNETSSICSVYDSQGKLTEQTDMLALKREQALAQNRSLSSSRIKTPIQESPLDGGGMGMMAMSSPVAPDHKSETFDYDYHGNRDEHTDKDGAVSTFTHNTVNQYDQVEIVYPLAGTYYYSFDHDNNGNLSEDNYGFLYTYDYRNRLTEIEDVVSFVYDALGRRIKKVDLVTGKITWYYHNLSGQVIAEYEQPTGEDPALARSFAYGNGISEILAMFLAEPPCDPADLDEFIDFASHWLCEDPNSCYDAQFDANSDDVIDLKDFAEYAAEWSVCSTKESRFYYLHDALGSVMGIVGGKFDRESDREFYNYEVYGQPLADSISSAAGNPFRFAGYRYDTESYLYDLRNRTYNPMTGRFLQFDPIGYADSMNLYEYVASNPTMYIDPLGLSLWDLLKGDLEKFTQDKYFFSPGVDQYLKETSQRLRAMPGAAKDALTQDIILVAQVCCKPKIVCDKASEITNAISEKASDIAYDPNPLKATWETGKQCCSTVAISIKNGVVETVNNLTSDDPTLSGDTLGRGFYQLGKGAVVAKGCETAIKAAGELIPKGSVADDIIRNTRGGTCEVKSVGDPYSNLTAPVRGSATWANEKTLADHFARHGKDFGTKTAQEYSQAASDFLRKSQAQGLPTKIGPDGTIRVYDPKTNTFGSYTAGGETRTFYKPDPAMHKYNTNLDYWNSQPGTSPWRP